VYDDRRQRTESGYCKVELIRVDGEDALAGADILPKRAGLRTAVAAMAADPPVTATVRPAVVLK
jgi:hypothetical protein